MEEVQAALRAISSRIQNSRGFSGGRPAYYGAEGSGIGEGGAVATSTAAPGVVAGVEVATAGGADRSRRRRRAVPDARGVASSSSSSASSSSDGVEITSTANADVIIARADVGGAKRLRPGEVVRLELDVSDAEDVAPPSKRCTTKEALPAGAFPIRTVASEDGGASEDVGLTFL